LQLRKLRVWVGRFAALGYSLVTIGAGCDRYAYISNWKFQSCAGCDSVAYRSRLQAAALKQSGHGMSATQRSNRIVSLSEFRAARDAAKRRNSPPTPYLLWYPGVGYMQVLPTVSGLTAAATPVGQNQPGSL
jgi:hypothetical protein